MALPNIFAAILTSDNFGTVLRMCAFVVGDGGCKEQNLTKRGDVYCKDTCGVVRTS